MELFDRNRCWRWQAGVEPHLGVALAAERGSRRAAERARLLALQRGLLLKQAWLGLARRRFADTVTAGSALLAAAGDCGDDESEVGGGEATQHSVVALVYVADALTALGARAEASQRLRQALLLCDRLQLSVRAPPPGTDCSSVAARLCWIDGVAWLARVGQRGMAPPCPCHTAARCWSLGFGRAALRRVR